MKRIEKIHDNISRFFFVVGFIANALSFIMPVFIGRICKLIVIGCNYGGYLFWMTSAQVSEDQERARKAWYAFTTIKNQHRLTSVTGGIATTLLFVGFFFPVALVPAFWLFVISNLIWLITTYHRKKQPPKDDPDYSPQSYSNYLTYVLLTTIASFITALSSTLILIFPIAAPIILLIGIGLHMMITTGSFIYLMDCIADAAFTYPSPNQDIQLNHQSMALLHKKDLNLTPNSNLFLENTENVVYRANLFEGNPNNNDTLNPSNCDFKNK